MTAPAHPPSDPHVDDDEIEAHPLVALPRPVRPGTVPLPSPVGEAPRTGRLSEGTLDATMAVAEALFSRDDGPPPGDRMSYLRDEYADLMARATWRGRLMFTAAAFLVSWLAPLSIRRLGPLGRLPLPERVRALRRFEAQPAGSMLIALRAPLCLIWYEHPASAEELGLPFSPEGVIR